MRESDIYGLIVLVLVGIIFLQMSRWMDRIEARLSALEPPEDDPAIPPSHSETP